MGTSQEGWRAVLGNGDKPGGPEDCPGEQGRARRAGLEDCPGWNHQSLAEDVSDSWIAHHLAFLFSGW